MIRYKVKFRTNNGYEFARYYEKRAHAIKARVNYNKKFLHDGCKATLVGVVEMKRHHTAIAKGYCGVSDYSEEYYEGRFGIGYIAHYPTLRYGTFKGNNWHLIEYITEVL